MSSYGTSLDGAFLIWGDLVRVLHKHLRGFMDEIVTVIMNALTSTSTVRADTDADKKALAEWLIHLVVEIAMLDDMDPSELAPVVLRHCCLHPGYWTQVVGHKVFEIADALEVDWGDLLDASVLREDFSGGQGLTAAAVKEAEPPGAECGDRIFVDEDGMKMSDDELRAESWTRSITAPSGPIGAAPQMDKMLY